ncbi:Deoxyhypusine synthase [Zea mays]|uniref:Deoxyhypusine synthase n=1 Tax=Zea mays TaxID=4577 RepID=A0A1D6ECU0_MAIZE|nr:Deoxyhypusine synthase [Zea mays]
MGAELGEAGVPARDMVDALEGVRSILLKPSERLDDKRFTRIAGADFDDAGLGLAGLLGSLASTGFQASNLGDAIDVVNQMVPNYVFVLTLSAVVRFAGWKLDWRLSHEKPSDDCAEAELDPAYRESVKCKIFLGFTSNLVSSGVREIIRFLVQHRMVDVIVTTAGGIEEDLIKCLAPTYRGDFTLPGALLRSRGLNRIGNLLVPNDNYCKFEHWIMPILDKMLLEQSTQNVWTPSKNNIPVFCPALTDGSIGDMLFCHSVHSPGLVVDIVQDVRLMNAETIHASPRKTGIILLGGGLPKHHICNANMLRDGADYAVYVNTAQEFDGSDSGARPDEAVSWGKIKSSARTVKVHCDATIAFPLLVAATFARKVHGTKSTN